MKQEIPFEYCAMQYLNLYAKSEKTLCESIESDLNSKNIRKVLSNYSVSRTFGGICPKNNPEIAEKNLDKIVSHVSDVMKSRANNTNKVVNLAKRFKADFGSYNISAASKLLWVLLRGDVTIYDSQAYKALELTSGSDYKAFVDAWEAGYASNRKGIKEAIKSLAEIPLVFTAAYAMSPKEFKSTIKSEWFCRRVYDQFLWRKS